MCVMSTVVDHFNPIMPQVPFVQQPFTNVPPLLGVELAELRELIAEFREAAEAAKTVDRLLGEPDCVDPAKGDLEARVRRIEEWLESQFVSFASKHPEETA